MNAMDFSGLTPDVSVLPFPSDPKDWVVIANFPDIAAMFAHLNGSREHEVFYVEEKFIETLGREQNMNRGEIVSDLMVVLPRWLKFQNERVPVPVGKAIHSRLEKSQINIVIGHLQQGYFVHLPR